MYAIAYQNHTCLSCRYAVAQFICMSCSAVVMTLDSYETKILEIREDIKRRFLDMMKIRAEKYGQLQVGISSAVCLQSGCGGSYFPFPPGCIAGNSEV